MTESSVEDGEKMARALSVPVLLKDTLTTWYDRKHINILPVTSLHHVSCHGGELHRELHAANELNFTEMEKYVGR